MITFLKTYKAFVYGLLIQWLVILILQHFELIHIDTSAVLSTILIFIFSGLLISLPIHYFSFLKKHKRTSLKLLVLLVFFLLLIINDMKAKTPDNPVTFVGLVGVGLFFFAIIVPLYFKKYALSLIGFYVLVLGYFCYLRIYIDDRNYYWQQEKEIKILLVVPLFVFLAGWFYQQWKWMKTVESKKIKAELSLLKNQINPHFFFNTLNNLYGLTIEKSPDAPDVVLKLADLMRYTIYMGKEDFVPLQEEIAYLKNYIELHKIRYQKKVAISFTYSQDRDYQVAPLLFIISLENAFKHGVECLTEDAYIRMDIKADKGMIYFEIENNFEERTSCQTIGIGIENLKQRLELLYPDKYEMRTKVQNSVYTVTLKIKAE